LLGQRKTQRDKLSLLVATMLHVRSANLVELASGLPRPSHCWDMGYQWIARFLANDLVSCDTVMQPFASEPPLFISLKPNTVHFAIWMAAATSIHVVGCGVGGRRG